MPKSTLPTLSTAFLTLVKSRSEIESPNQSGIKEEKKEKEEKEEKEENGKIKKNNDAVNTASQVLSGTLNDDSDSFAHADPLSSRVLWLAVYFPQLAIEMPAVSHADEDASSNTRTLREYSPASEQQSEQTDSRADMVQTQACLLAVEKLQGRLMVHSVSDVAAAHGISVGMSLNAAYSLYSNIEVRSYDEQQQRRYMEHLAAWAMQFSSQVSVADSATLLLEIKGSMRYYGGLQHLLRRFSQQLAEYRAHQIQIAVAPTAAAGLLLAKSQTNAPVLTDYRRLRAALASVPIRLLPLSHKLKQQLRRLGLRYLQDLWRLPREDLSRRYGETLVVYLDALTGMNTEMLDYYRLPDHFTSQWHLDYETRDAAALVAIVKCLLEKLEEYLIQCDYHIHGYSVELWNGKKKPHVITVGLRKPGRQLSHLLNLFEEQLKRYTLRDKVSSVKLHSRHLVKATVCSASLAFSPEFLQSQNDSGIEIDALLDLVQARLGSVAVKSIHSVADHRPEFAATSSPVKASNSLGKDTLREGRGRRAQASSAKADAALWKQRPLWLLPDPHPLRTQRQQPIYGDVLKLLEGPERIESAWWSGNDVRRDYYYAITPNGQRLWIYQELNAPFKWYLHGFFA